MKIDISIIIPIYKGKKYIPYLLDTISKNVKHLSTLHLQCELILVNDFPEEQIMIKEDPAYGYILKVLNTRENQGIHGARVFGLEHAKGEWVVFLDQDDRITDDYLIKQKLCIGDADAVICNGYVTRYCMDICDFIYADEEEQRRTQNLSYYISTGNPIYSPGQVMLKRKAIASLWRQHQLKANGADDYLLWILMLKEGRRFVLNKEKLYTHVGHGNNVSSDIASMARSIHEVEKVLEENSILDNREKEIIRCRDLPGLNRHRSVDIIATYDYWLYLEHRRHSITDYLLANGYFRIAIYGMSSLGNRLCDLLAESGVDTVFALDRRARRFTCGIPVLCIEDEMAEEYLRRVDAVIVTAESSFPVIKGEIEKKYTGKVLSLKGILLEMIEGLREQ